MELKPANSSNITHVGYDEPSKEMHVTFSSGKTYSYANVEPEHYQGLINADSIGSHFASQIRPNYMGKAV
jgi:hypothetical protein